MHVQTCERMQPICVCVHAHTGARVCLCGWVCVYAHMCSCMRICVCTWCANAKACAYTHDNAHVHCVCVHKYVCRPTCVRVYMLVNQEVLT